MRSSSWFDQHKVSYQANLAKLILHSAESWQIEKRSASGALASSSPTDAFWAFFEHRQAPELPSAFWKIHLSVHPSELEKLFSLATEVLINESTAFKLPACLEAFMAMNEGATASEQLGKIVTVYPVDEEHVRVIAERIDCFWGGRRGPAIASDLYRDQISAVSIRFGECGETSTRLDSCGRVVRELALTDGRVVADVRSATGEQTIGGSSALVGGELWRALNLAAPKELTLEGEKFHVERRIGPWFKQVLFARSAAGDYFALHRS